MATQFDPNDSVDQASLEQQEAPQRQVKFEGYEDEMQQQEQPPVDTVDEGGVAELIEDTAPAQKQEEVQQEVEAPEDIVEIGEQPPEVPQPRDSDEPDFITKLKEFHKDTGGGINEYIQHTKDFDSLGDMEVLKEYYKLTKPQYSEDDINLLIDDKFKIGEYEEGEEIPREERLKVLAMKDELMEAKKFLGSNREKYFSDMKSGVSSAPDQYKEAVEYFEQSKVSQKKQEETRQVFLDASQKLLSQDFKGFTFEADGKKYRMNAGNPDTLRDEQSDINQVLSGMLDENGVPDAHSYHKAVWAARNADKIFNAAYEQGKAAAIKERAKASKNPDYTPNSGQSQAPKPQQKVKFLGNDFNNEW